VLKRVHGPGVHIDVRVQLLEGDPKPPGFQQGPNGRRRHSLAQRGQHPAGDENYLGLHTPFNIPAHRYCQAGGEGHGGMGLWGEQGCEGDPQERSGGKLWMISL